MLSGIRHHFPAKVVRAYVAGNRAGQSLMLQVLAEQKVSVQRRDASTYAGTPDGTALLDKEFGAGDGHPDPRSLRTAPADGEELLIVGGNGHPVGRNPPTSREVEDLDAWTLQHFLDAERTHRWSARDYQSASMVPFVWC